MKPTSIILKSIKTKNTLLDKEYIEKHYIPYLITDILYKEEHYLNLCKHLNTHETEKYTHYLILYNLGAKILQYKAPKKYLNSGLWKKFKELGKEQLSYREYTIHHKYDMIKRY